MNVQYAVEWYFDKVSLDLVKITFPVQEIFTITLGT